MKKAELIAWGIFYCIFFFFAGYVGLSLFDRIFKVTDYLMRQMS